MTAPVVRLEGVSRTFPGTPPVHALRDVAFVVETGDYVSVAGPSGSGKSTLLHVLGLLERPTAGRYYLDGADVATLTDAQRTAQRGRKIGFVFQDFHLLRHRTVIENVMLALLYNRFPRRQRRDVSVRAIEQVGLIHRLDAMPDTLSGGERQRVAIARAIAPAPRLLLADEPTGNLDTATTEALLDTFDVLHGAGLTLIVVTHDSHVSARAERCVGLVDGVLTEGARIGVPA